MSKERFKLSHLEILEFALEGVTTTIGVNSGNPDWTVEDWQYHYAAQKEIERRIKIIKVQEKYVATNS